MPIAEFSIGPLGTNCYVIHKNGDAVVVDPGGTEDCGLNEVLLFLEEQKLTVHAVLLTHLHFDHIYGVAELMRRGASAHASAADFHMLESSLGRGKVYGFPLAEGFTAQALVAGPFSFGAVNGTVLSTPGHTPGGLSFYLPEENSVLAGDTLFARSIGRTDLPGGDFPTLRTSIVEQLFTLPENTVVYPGHGPQTSIGSEKANNPYI